MSENEKKLQESVEYSAESIQVLEGLEAVGEDLPCILVISE